MNLTKKRGEIMNIKTIKKIINHSELVSRDYSLVKYHKGFFKIDDCNTIMLVFEYRKPRYVENVDVGYFIRYYNRLGLIYECQC